MMSRFTFAAGLACALAGLGWALAASPLPRLAATIPATDLHLPSADWGSVKGRVVFAGDKLPEPETLKVDKDQDHCLQKGPIKSKSWVINSANKGVANVVVFLRPEAGKKHLIHESLATPTEKQVVLDQPFCVFEPRIFALREDQTLLAKNPAPVAHNVVIQGFKNSQNVQLAPGTERSFQLFAENNPIALSCGVHPWMKGNVWVFDHPYFAVTDKDGNFEIKLAPAGNETLVLWHEETGYLEGRKGRQIAIPAGGVADVGTINLKPN